MICSRVFFWLLIGAFWAHLEVAAQQSVPHVTSYSKIDYEAGRQNWDIDIDGNGVIYFANTEGLLYNVYGEWGVVGIPGDGAIRTIFAQNDTVWAGGSVLGYFIKQREKFLFKKISEPIGSQIWNIQAIGNNIVYQSEYELIYYNKQNQSLNTFTVEKGGGIWSILEWNEELWYVLKNGEIGVFENEIFKQVSTPSQLLDKEVRKTFIHNDQMYIVTFSGNLYSYNGSEISEIELPEKLKGKKLFSGDNYDQNSFSLGTINDGYYRVDNQGNVLQSVNSQSGLIDDTILEMKVDDYGNVWLGLDYGVSKIELQSPFHPVFKGGATYDILDVGNHTYLATNKGLFKEGEVGQYHLIENSGGQVWNLEMIDDDLYVCHIKGLFKVNNEQLKLEATFGGFIDIARFEGTNTFIFSTYHGLFQVSRQEDGTFTDVINLEIWSQPELIYDKNSSSIWAESPTGIVYQISLAENELVEIKEHSQIEKIFDVPDGVFLHDGKSLFVAEKNQFKLVEHPLLDGISGNIYAMDLSKDGSRVAYLKEDSLKVDVILPDGNIHSYNKLFASMIKDVMYDYTHLNLQGENLRITTDRGVISFNFDFRANFEKRSEPKINVVYRVGTEDAIYIYPYPESGISLDKESRDLQFNFGVNHSYYDLVEFRYKLSPVEKEWSVWSSSKSALFSQLNGGTYTLFLQSRTNGGEELKNQLVFTIKEYWYETRWVMIPIILFIGIFTYGMVLITNIISKRRLRRQSQTQKTRYAQKSIRLKNEQLLQYVEIISHKNEFLNQVKQGLEKMRNTASNRWVNRINDEVNNEKKEFLFHKLFSEVHQDFIERITHEFPSLTANDIRVLSFVRVNLQNREIANLMNISPKSLDTTRYRIRKKMDLDHEKDLNKFIREF